MNAQTVALDIQELYHKILYREGDDGGIAYWVDQVVQGNTSIQGVENTFTNTDEHMQKKRLVDLYVRNLGRYPDSGGMNYYLPLLQKGFTDQDITNRMALDDEYKQYQLTGVPRTDKEDLPRDWFVKPVALKSTAIPTWLIVAIGGGAILVIVFAFLIIKKIKKG